MENRWDVRRFQYIDRAIVVVGEKTIGLEGGKIFKLLARAIVVFNLVSNKQPDRAGWPGAHYFLEEFEKVGGVVYGEPCQR